MFLITVVRVISKALVLDHIFGIFYIKSAEFVQKGQVSFLCERKN